MRNFIKQLFCKHECVLWVRNVYGDEINRLSANRKTVRSIWRCKKCGKSIMAGELYREEN